MTGTHFALRDKTSPACLGQHCLSGVLFPDLFLVLNVRPLQTMSSHVLESNMGL